MTLADRIRLWAGVARDLLALLFTPVVTLLCIWLICVLAYGAWSASSDGLRIHYLGALAIVFAVLIGLGGQWFQRNRLEKLKLTGPGGFSGEIETEAEGPAVITTTTKTEIE